MIYRRLADVLILLALILGAAHAGAAQKPELPRRIVMTEADCKEINSKRTLRGRPVEAPTMWEKGRELWSGTLALTGRKRDVINCLMYGEGIRRTGGQGWIYMQGYQCDLLVSQLLQTGDVDIIRAVIRRTYWTGKYLVPDWELVLRDKRLAAVDRAEAWRRIYEWRDDGAAKEAELRRFWVLLGGALTHDDIVELVMKNRFEWSVLGKNATAKVPKKQVEALLRPLVRREYLEINDGGLVQSAGGILRRVYGADNLVFRRELLDKVIAWDKAEDKRSLLLWISGLGNWKGLGDWSKADAEMAKKLRTLAVGAKLAHDAGLAFHAYASTPAGRKEIDKRGWQGLFADYVRFALSHSTRKDRVQFLRALTGFDRIQRTARGKVVHFRQLGPFLQALRAGNVQLVVSEKEGALLNKAWKQVPEALKHVEVRNEVKKDERAMKDPAVQNGQQ